MGLFADGPLTTIDELREHDSQLANVASTEGIDVTRKLALAHDELGIELDALFSQVQRTGGPRLEVRSVVTTAPLRAWHAYRALEMVYEDGYYTHLNDRYKQRRDQFHELARWAHGKLRDVGVGMATIPVPQAAPPVISSAPGILPTGQYYATMAWVNSAGEEGAPAAPVAFTVVEAVDEGADQSFMVVAQNAPATATGWNVYTGTSAEQLVRQNSDVLGAGDVWFAMSGLQTEGPGPGTGQQPNFYQAVPRLFQRG